MGTTSTPVNGKRNAFGSIAPVKTTNNIFGGSPQPAFGSTLSSSNAFGSANKNSGAFGSFGAISGTSVSSGWFALTFYRMFY